MPPSTYHTTTWHDHPLYLCPCGYNSTALVKMEAHQAVCRWQPGEEPPPPEIIVAPPEGPPASAPDALATLPPGVPDTVTAVGAQGSPEDPAHA